MRTYLICIGLALVIWACDDAVSPTTAGARPTIVATTGMLADMLTQIVGDDAEVVALMGPGVDPHLYKATHGDLQRLQAADLICYNGLHLEGKMGEIFKKLARTRPVLAVAEGIPANRLLANDAFADSYDPHIWFDVSLWMQAVDVTTGALVAQFPQHAEAFGSRAEAYKKELSVLHDWVAAQMDSIPTNQRVLITAHDAFHYFGRAYGIEVQGLQGISTLSEFGLKDRVDLVNFIAGRGVKAVFVETSVSEKNISSIVEACQQKGHPLRIGGHLYSDAMGAPGTPEGTYTGMIRANVQTIASALHP